VEVEGIKLHYLTAGRGPTLILLHGYTQTSRMWRPIIPLLAERFTVIAPDLPGIGDSDVPAEGLDMKMPPSAFTRWPAPLAFRKQKSWDMTSVSWWPTPTPRNFRQRHTSSC
jgi:pimeloyl-ACP methyl ester carboxylesterase